MATLLAGLALLISIGLFIVHYKNQIERRHGELTQLHAQIVSDLSALQQRLASLLIHGEIVRLELRRLPEGPAKYESIEQMPDLLNSISALKTDVEEFNTEFSALDMKRHNRTAILLRLQSSARTIQRNAFKAQEIENKMLYLLKRVREQIKT